MMPALKKQPTALEVEMLAARMRVEILADMVYGRIPTTVASFSELHDHTDANMYGEDVWQLLSERYGWDAMVAALDTAQGLVHVWLEGPFAENMRAEASAPEPEPGNCTVEICKSGRVLWQGRVQAANTREARQKGLSAAFAAGLHLDGVQISYYVNGKVSLFGECEPLEG